MSDILRQKLEQLEAKRAELDRFRARLGEANRLVAQESDRLVNLMGQLSTLLKRETWNAMMGARTAPGRPAGAGGPRPPQGRPPASVSSALSSQAAAAVDAAIKQADVVQGRLATLVRGLTETPATVRPAAPADEEEELAIDVDPAPAPAPVRVAAMVAPPKAPPPPYTGPSSAAWSKSHPPPPLVAPAPVVAAAPRPVAPAYSAAPEPAAPAHAAPAPVEDIQEAVETGRRALESLDRSLAAARGVSRGGVLRTAAGMVRSQSPARIRLGEARQAAHEAAEDLRLLQKQVKELRHRLGDHVEVGQLGAMAEQLAAAIPEEGGDESHVHGALSKVHQTYHEVRAICSRLQLDAAVVRSHLAARDRGRPKTLSRS